MQITLTIEDGPTPQVFSFASERAAVEMIQGGLGLPRNGNWDAATTAALLRVLSDPSRFGDLAPLRNALLEDINAATAARVANAEQLKSALIVSQSHSINLSISMGVSITPSTVTIPLGVVAPGVGDPPRPNPDSTPPDGGPGKPDGGTGAASDTILGLPKPVAIGLGVGLGVFLLGGLVLASSRNS